MGVGFPLGHLQRERFAGAFILIGIRFVQRHDVLIEVQSNDVSLQQVITDDSLEVRLLFELDEGNLLPRKLGRGLIKDLDVANRYGQTLDEVGARRLPGTRSTDPDRTTAVQTEPVYEVCSHQPDHGRARVENKIHRVRLVDSHRNRNEIPDLERQANLVARRVPLGRAAIVCVVEKERVNGIATSQNEQTDQEQTCGSNAPSS